MLNFSTVMLGSQEPEPLRTFYVQVLGEPAWDQGGFTGWQAGNAMLMIGPHSEVKGKNETPGRIILNFETPDVRGEARRLKDLGATMVQEPYQPNSEMDMWLATFEDLDGNYFQLASPMPSQ